MIPDGMGTTPISSSVNMWNYKCPENSTDRYKHMIFKALWPHFLFSIPIDNAVQLVFEHWASQSGNSSKSDFRRVGTA